MTKLIGLLIDSSGSMSHIASDSIGSLNTLIKSQKDNDVGQSLIISTFSDEYVNIIPCSLVKDISFIKESDYRPMGGTALFYSMSKFIDILDEEYNKGNYSGVLMIVITDGQENSSKEGFNWKTVKAKIDTRKPSGWEFDIIGATEEVLDQVRGDQTNKTTFDMSSTAGIKQMYSATALRCSNSARGLAYDNEYLKSKNEK